MPRKMYDTLDLPPLEKCYYDVTIANVAKKKPLGRINDILIMVNNNLVPVDFFLWMLNAILHVLLFWEDPFFEL
jgi:hypothetical protein